MSCYHPMAFRPVYASNGEIVDYKYMSQYSPELKIQEPALIKVPCGKCLGCRLDYSRTWADRMMYELDSFQGSAVFVTLTYSDDFVPPAFDTYEDGEVILDDDGDPVVCGYTLRKEDLQKFFKRLRKSFAPRLVRYYACGEYGRKPRSGRFPRPHYHAIIFGISLFDFDDRRRIGVNELGQSYYASETFSKIWPFGFSVLSEVSYKTCAYVSRYCSKKVFSEFDLPGFCEPEFTLMSRRPGIGSFYLELHPDFFDTSHKFFSDHNGSVKAYTPKFFLDKLRLTNSDLFDKIKEERSLFASDKELLKLKQTSLSFEELSRLEEVELIDKTKILFKRREEVNHAT